MKKLGQKSELGQTGLFVPPIIFGTSALGNLYKALDEDIKLDIIRNWFEWVEAPVVIDTAGKYGAGLALEAIGNGLRKLKIDPKDILISNKLGWYRTELKTTEPTFEPGVWANLNHDAEQKISYDGMMACYEQGLELLGGEYKTEILSVHDPDEYLGQVSSKREKEKREQDILDSYRALYDLKKQEKVKAVGIGAKDWKVIKSITDKMDLDWVMLATSFTIMEHPKELIDFIDELQQRNISVINSAVFHGGFLTGTDYYNYRKLDRDSDEVKPLYAWRSSFYRICDKYNIRPADVCILFSLSHPAIVGIALNSSRSEAIRRNIELLSKKIPTNFWLDMKSFGLIGNDYNYI